ncbi:hypothetical protein ASE05_01885 [Mesorhizobium sp. Root172]|uniref:Uncharacterized protein n=2 Tax=Phyllobacteriaceae TaxID=69277 RepID=A0AA91F8K2_RHILI|nr:hypothetical protein ASE05_01885 [Mesorhizobium sp. Root172]OBQ72142.1 hypothetical protein A8145_04750 [Mesorhizobium loti]
MRKGAAAMPPFLLCGWPGRRDRAAKRKLIVLQHPGHGLIDVVDRDCRIIFRGQLSAQALRHLGHAGARHLDDQLVLAAREMEIERASGAALALKMSFSDVP